MNPDNIRRPTVYILTNKPQGTLYTGVTAFPTRRQWQHLSKINPDSFAAKYNLNRLVYMEHFPTMPQAIKREKEIKGWQRNRKLSLISKYNPNWDDLTDRLMDFCLGHDPNGSHAPAMRGRDDVSVKLDSFILSTITLQTQAQLTPISPAPREGLMMVAQVMGMDPNNLLLHGDRLFLSGKQPELDALVARRLTGEPLAYVLGKAPFWSRDWRVEAGVLIPRPDTETLVQAVLEILSSDKPARIAEVGVGSGAIVGSILLERPLITAVGTDIANTPLRVATHNTREAGVSDRLTLIQTDILEGVEGPFDLILSNPPYIDAADYAALDASVREHEPRDALLAGMDGLDVYRRLIPAAANKLMAGGWLFLEIGWQQAAAVSSLMNNTGFTSVTTLPDIAQRDRVVIGQRA